MNRRSISFRLNFAALLLSSMFLAACGGGNSLVSSGGSSDTFPQLAISSPDNGSVFTDEDDIMFSASARDEQDGNISNNIRWASSQDGEIGAGATILSNNLSISSHTITASVVDSAGNTSESSLNIVVSPVSTNNGAAPTLTIGAPSPSNNISVGVNLTLTATAVDDEDGNISSAINWSSNLSGSLGSGASVSSDSLAVGTHTMLVSVRDSDNNLTQRTISIFVSSSASNSNPSLSIESPSPSTRFTPGSTIVFTGQATDSEDGDISDAITWASSLDGQVGVGQSVSVSTLSIGTHSVTATVSDSDGASVSESIFVVVSDSSATTGRAKYHVFGHSLFVYDGGDDAPATGYTRAGVWMGLLAGASNTESIGSFTFANIFDAADLDWSSASSVRVNGHFNLGNTSPYDDTGFANQDYTHIISMPSNFLDADMGASPPYDRTTDNTRASFEQLDANIDRYYPGAEHFLYVHWPDGEAGQPVGSSGSRSDFTYYNNSTMNEYLDWHIRLQDSLLANGVSVRTIPVGPIIAWLFENESYLMDLNFYDVYGDTAPHGSENIYLLSALVVYQTIFGVQPNFDNFGIPTGATQIRSEIANNLPAIAAAIDARLDYHEASGVNVR